VFSSAAIQCFSAKLQQNFVTHCENAVLTVKINSNNYNKG